MYLYSALYEVPRMQGVSSTHIDTHLDDSSTAHWTDTHTDTERQTDIQTVSVTDTHRNTSRWQQYNTLDRYTHRHRDRQTYRLSVSPTHIDMHLDDTAVQHTGQIHTLIQRETDIQTDAQTINVSDTHRHTSRWHRKKTYIHTYRHTRLSVSPTVLLTSGLHCG